MTATSLDLSQIKTDALSSAATFRTLIGLGSSDTVTFKEATLTSGTVTSSTPVINATQTWNDGATTFTGFKLNVTDTASASASLLMDLQVGGGSRFNVRKDGQIVISGASLPVTLGYETISGLGRLASNNYARFGVMSVGYNAGGQRAFIGGIGGFSNNLVLGLGYNIQFSSLSAGEPFTLQSAVDLSLSRDDAGILAQRNGTNAQTFRLYNTYTSSTSYERGFMRWNSNVLEIGAEAGSSGGTVRRVDITSTGGVNIDGGAISGYSLLRSGDKHIGAGSAGPRFIKPPYPGATIVDIGLQEFPFRNIFLKPSSSLTPTNNGDLCIEATNNTTLTFKYKGSDGTVRSGTITLS